MPRRQKKYHYIYKTTNILNNKYYIGMHSTDDLDDGYVGSGKRLWYSINKYGKENHKTEILEYLPDRESLKMREAEIINVELLNEKLCMNLALGGRGDWNYANEKITYEERQQRMITANHNGAGDKGRIKQKWLIANDLTWRKNFSKRISTSMKSKSLELYNNSHEIFCTFLGKNHTEKTKEKMSKAKKGKYCSSSNANAKAVIDNNGQLFDTINDCAHFHGIHPCTVTRRIKKGIYKLGLKQLTNK